MAMWSAYLLLLAVSIFGLALAVLGLPGIWLIVLAAAGYAWMTGGVHLIWCLLVLIALGALAEFLETALGGVAAKKAGGSKRGMVAAIIAGLVGGVVGTPIFPVIGTLLGACAGAFVGAFAVEFLWLRKSSRDSLAIGYASAKGRLYGMIVKLLAGVLMLATVALWALPSWYPTGGTPTTLPAPQPNAPAATQPSVTTAPSANESSEPGAANGIAPTTFPTTRAGPTP